MKDQHDPRDFRQYVRFDNSGNVISVHEVASNIENPYPDGVEVTALAGTGTALCSCNRGQIIAAVKAHRGG